MLNYLRGVIEAPIAFLWGAVLAPLALLVVTVIRFVLTPFRRLW